MSKEIRKEAKIVEIREDVIVLEMCSHEACGACLAKGMCGEESGTPKRIELHNDGIPRNPGDTVTLLISSTMGLKGAFFAYFLPVIVVLCFIIVMQRSGCNDFMSGGLALLVLALYFLILRFFRDKIEKNILITIE